MAVELQFAVLGEQLVDRTLADVADAVGDWRPAFEVLRGRFLELERRQFATEGGYSGGWAPLSPAYAAWKAKRYPGKPILRRTDDLFLFRSLTVGPEIAIIEPQRLTLGTAVRYAGFHQDPQGGRLPRRPPVALPAGERDEWVKVLQSYAVTGGVTGVRGVAAP